MAIIRGNNNNNTLKGTSALDKIYGYDGKDTIYGYKGNDIIDGGKGADRIFGGYGDDVFYVDNSQDKVFEYANQGTDKIRTTVSYKLPDNVELLTLLGPNDINGVGNNLNNILYGNNASNTMEGKGGNDRLYGRDGSDFLYGNDGNDTLEGGRHTDILTGGKGIDTYIFNKGDGRDKINESASDGTYNIIKFGAGIDPDDLNIQERFVISSYGDEEFAYIEDNIAFKNSNDYIEIGKDADWFNITFPNRVTYGFLDLIQSKITGTPGDDIITGNTKPNIIYTYEGNDKVISNTGGNDTIYTGDGDDFIKITGFGGRTIPLDRDGNPVNYSNDYISSGSGNDTISKNGGDNRIYAGSGNDKIVTAMDIVENIPGIGGNDLISGDRGHDLIKDEGGSDTFSGGRGNDTIISYDKNEDFISADVKNWNDTYLFAIGDGQDTIKDYRGDDTIRFGKIINKYNLDFTKDGDDLIVSINGTSDKITIDNWFISDPEYDFKIETFEFADGTALSYTDIPI